MASRKVLKSVARSVADSFTSLMNWGDDDYVLGHILAAARLSSKTAMEVDLLTGDAAPEKLLQAPVRRSILRERDW